MECQRRQFKLPSDVSYLNCAYMSPLSNQVIETGQQAVECKSKPYLITAEHFFEPVSHLKENFAQLIGAPKPGRISIFPSVSYGMASVAKNLKVKEGQNIVIAKEQFPSNAYCWMSLCRHHSLELRIIAPPDNNQERGLQWNIGLMEAIDDNTVAVAIGTIHWTDGTCFELAAIRAKTAAVGAKLILDGTQSVGAMPINVAKLQPDALICAGYKWLLGPYGIALGYFDEFMDGGEPLEENWINRLGSDDFRGQVGYQAHYHPQAVRYDMGEKSNFILIPMLNAALSQLLHWQVTEIQSYCQRITASPIDQLKNNGFTIEKAGFRAPHLFGIRTPASYQWQKVYETLKELKVFVSLRGDAIRISPHLYNTPEDMKKLCDGLMAGL